MAGDEALAVATWQCMRLGGNRRVGRPGPLGCPCCARAYERMDAKRHRAGRCVVSLDGQVDGNDRAEAGIPDGAEHDRREHCGRYLVEQKGLKHAEQSDGHWELRR